MDGMGLAIAVGHCWEAMPRGVPGFSPVAEKDVVLAGVREIELREQQRLATSGVAVVGADLIGREGLQVLAEALDGLRSRVSRAYLHLDLDVLDPARVGRANELAPEGGLSADDPEAALRVVRERFAIAACGIASYDPTFDADGRVLRAALACARLLTTPEAPAV
jgi:arginase